MPISLTKEFPPGIPLIAPTPRKKAIPSLLYSVTKKEYLDNPKQYNITFTFYHKKPPLEILSKLQENNSIADNLFSHAKQYISLIEDPLWKYVCIEVLKMMGPSFVLKIWNSELGSLTPQDKIVYIYSQTEEGLQYFQQYGFVILGSLQKYFPSLKEIKTKNNFLKTIAH